MADTPQTVDVPVTLHLSKEASEAIAQRAAARGADLSQVVSEIVERNTKKPISLEEISGPVYQRFIESGMSDEELGDLLEREKHEARAEERRRRTRRAS